MIIKPISPNEVNRVWCQIEPWVLSALGEDKSMSPLDIKTICMADKMQLWFIYTTELKGFLITQIYDAPQCKICYAPWLGGRDLESWVKDAFDKFKEYLREQGVKQYSFVGRDAWKKLIDADYSGRFYLITL